MLPEAVGPIWRRERKKRCVRTLVCFHDMRDGIRERGDHRSIHSNG